MRIAVAGLRLTVCAALAGAALAAETPAGMKPGDIALTIYTPDTQAAESTPFDQFENAPLIGHLFLEAEARYAGLGVVRECRTIPLPQGVSEYRFPDVAALIDPTTTRFLDQTDPQGTRVLEQSFYFDLADEGAVLKRFLGRRVELTDGAGRTHAGKLLMPGPPLLLQLRDGSIEMVHYGDPVGRYFGTEVAGSRSFRFPELPKDLVTRPTLAWTVQAQRAGNHEVVVSYQTGGMTWRADYTALMSGDEGRLDLSGWVTIANVSGARFPNARIKLFAGDVRRFLTLLAREGGYASGRAMARDFFGTEEEPAFKERQFFEYHLYTLRWRTTLENNQTKQIEFLNVPGVPVKRVYTYDGAQVGESDWFFAWDGTDHRDETYGTKCRKTVRVNLEVENKEAAKLGIPLPGGIVRVYKLDEADGHREFVGEDKIKHTPRDETLHLYIGDAFDLVGERVRTDYKEPKEWQILESFEVELRNHKDKPVTIQVLEHLYRGVNWRIEKSSIPFEKLDAQSIQFKADVPANGKTKVSYTVLYWWPRAHEEGEDDTKF